LSSKFIGLISCRETGESIYISARLTEKCYDNTFNFYTFGFIIPSIICINFLIPGLLLGYLIKNRKFLNK